MTSNQIKYWSLEETKRSNKANEREVNRHNITYERETERHNRATEQETNRHNVATENLTSADVAEKIRHNGMTELAAEKQLAEATRSHQANESLQSRQIGLGYANLGLGYGQLSEAMRHNKANEIKDIMSLNDSIAYHDELARHNQQVEQQAINDWAMQGGRLNETQRHNITTEGFEEKALPHRIISGYMSGAGSMVRGIAGALK